MGSTSRLFEPLTLGNMHLKHRIAMAPMARIRADDERVPTPAMVEYYSQRASVPGTLIITEGSFISHDQVGYANAPGIYNDAQVDGWRKVTDAVHARGSYIVAQLLAVGRSIDPTVAAQEGITIRSSSAVPRDENHPAPEPMTVEQIHQTVQDFATAARNAIRAGFDAVEIHGAYGYLVDQFVQDTVNRRTDEYGGSIERRSRFAIEVVEAVVKAVGPRRTALRLSPWSRAFGMGMEDPVPQFSHLIREISALGPLAYLHLLEPSVHLIDDIETPEGESLDFAVEQFDGPVLLAGGYKAESALKVADQERPNKDVVVVFGRYFTSNPDLAFRVKEGVEFTPYRRDRFYTPKLLEGFTDFPPSEKFRQTVAAC